jgi:XRE family transcriptional regulator, regulator of sulfur utilization
MNVQESASDLARLGKKIRDSRKGKHITLEMLATDSGVSKSVLSQVERGVTNPTLSTLWNIARALSLDPLELFGSANGPRDDDEEDTALIAEINAPVIESKEWKYRLIILNPPEMAGKCELYRLLLRAGGVLKSNPHENGAMEQVTVIEGEVEIRCGEDTMRIGTGQSARYPGNRSHAISAVGRKEANVLLFVTFE